MPTNITTELLGEHPALELAATELELTTSWIRGGDGLIGFGEWRSTSVKGKNRFADARKWWHEQLATLKIENSVHGSGTGPILFSSFSFDSAEESKLVIPEIIIGKRGDKSWITWIGDKSSPPISDFKGSKSIGKISFESGALNDVAWKESVAKAASKIRMAILKRSF